MLMNKEFGMFSEQGNLMVHRIAAAGKKLVELDGDRLNAWQFAYRELQKLSYAEGMEECTDTEVREAVYVEVVGSQVTYHPESRVPFYI